ncbi:ATP-binding protein [Methylotenera sp.]|uniref:ATP-binding protein n=1 Tax=Methylotenera sp. TaxID=2051956 RepID=UPI002725239C|nr:ATP-binding protein [Methylotenera sp.]MDO9204961.1 ATP-binding protein [Methylotenera sp.]MDO9393688.1 ATP-binding protein [Methylotenera sp.]MDP2071148.1 ATP-binding protein [Methylotenera sp.]MDP2230074.1 ATP-binding protein [Methylotenera sp.]MDP3007311.1 ATP-binding protein [Methylotenera sp.]
MATHAQTRSIYPISHLALENPSRRNLKRLFLLRSVMIAFMLSATMALFYLHIPLPKLPIALAVGGMLLINLMTMLRLQKHSNVNDIELLLQLLGDLAALTMLFYYTGGYSNPLVWMYLLPLTVAAVALKREHAWLLTAIAVACYSTLVFYYVPLSHLHMHDLAGQTLDIHLVGMWLGFVVSAGIIAFFITRIGQSLRDYDRVLASIREKSLESERMLALGTLATSAAHELGTPLATMAVISKELAHDLASQPEQLQQLDIMVRQILRCKEILSSITRDAGKGRADAGHGMALREYLQEAIQRWRDTRPATELVITLSENIDNPLIFTDKTLTQALQNLLDNAADASPERILLDAEWDETVLKINIRDFGAGITEDVAKHLGKPFFTSKSEKGMGLGVYLTHTTLARYEGELNLSNHVDGGVLTTVTLPLKKLKVSQ